MTENDWRRMFQEVIDGKFTGHIVSKVAPPSGVPCDHRESVYDFHKKVLKKLADTMGFVALEGKSQVMYVRRRNT